MTFNYLADAPPEFVERLRNIRVPAELQTPLAALLTALIVIAAWWGLERHWVAEARREEAAASVRLKRSRDAFTATRLVRADVDKLLALDGRVRRIRLSGSELSEGLADIGNHVPSRAWLTSISHANEGFEIHGKAEGLNVLSDTVTALISSKIANAATLVRAVREDRNKGGLISFSIRLAQKSEP